ncbi:MAG: hypothetical protein HY268_07170 [Deltaproteobacteria bacterium]|nr:hypothetical protein [Deltaproteobacteria bacterium]
MLTGIIKGLFARFGYEVRKIPQNREERPGFMLYKYLKADGSFDYEKYRQTQIEGNKRKIQKVWALEEHIVFLSNYIKTVIGMPQFGICHGTRRGKEQEWFRKYLGCEVIGTEISNIAEQFPYTIQWDFHETRPEWIDATDFVYSNSFDHSYDPEKCLNAWMSCLKKGGICILEHTSHGHRASEINPFYTHIVQMPYLIATWGKGSYGVRELMETPKKHERLEFAYFIVIQKF